MIYDNKIKFTGIVVTYNERQHLRQCLQSISFCDQLIVCDLGSKDDSIKIAEEFATDIIYCKWVPVIEKIRQKVLNNSKNDWIVFIDPDEIFPSNIISLLRDVISNNPEIAIIDIPWKFYFKGMPVEGSFWGTLKSKGVVFHKNRIKTSPLVHANDTIVEGYFKYSIPPESHYYLRHNWANSYKQLFQKHWRYIKHEGESRYQRNQRFNWTMFYRETLATLKYNLINYNGIRGGFVSIFLSFFYTWYFSMSLLSLRKYQLLIMEQKKYPVFSN